MWNLEADGLQQQETTHGAGLVNWEQETEATIYIFTKIGW